MDDVASIATQTFSIENNLEDVDLDAVHVPARGQHVDLLAPCRVGTSNDSPLQPASSVPRSPCPGLPFRSFRAPRPQPLQRPRLHADSPERRGHPAGFDVRRPLLESERRAILYLMLGAFGCTPMELVVLWHGGHAKHDGAINAKMLN